MSLRQLSFKQPQKFNLRYFAVLREQRGLEQEEILTEAATARDLYNEISGFYRFTLPPEKISVAINNQFCSLDHSLRAGDQIVFIPPIAGG